MAIENQQFRVTTGTSPGWARLRQVFSDGSEMRVGCWWRPTTKWAFRVAERHARRMAEPDRFITVTAAPTQHTETSK